MQTMLKRRRHLGRHVALALATCLLLAGVTTAPRLASAAISPHSVADVSVGADGSAWLVLSGGRVYTRVNTATGSQWELKPGGLHTIDVGNATRVIGIAPEKTIWRWNGKEWQLLAASGLPRPAQTSIGSDGSAWYVGTDASIWRWNETGSWQRMPGGLRTIDVGSATNVVGIAPDNTLWRWNGTRWRQLPGVGAVTSISTAADGSLWATTVDGTIWSWNGSWTRLPGRLDTVDVGSARSAYGLIGQQIWSWNGTSWSSVALPVVQPADVAPIPTARQVDNLLNEVITMVSFGINTMTGREWGDPTVDYDPALYNPQNFDADQWAAATQRMGSDTMVLIAKHHDGFANWFTATDPAYSTAATPFRRDIVAELAPALASRNMHLGIYLSTWDHRWLRQHPQGTGTEYTAYLKQQWRELLTNYGPVTVAWMDGAGMDSMRMSPANFTDLYNYIRSLQPGISIQCWGYDAFWVGNEAGAAPLTQWNFAPYRADDFRIASDQPHSPVNMAQIGLGKGPEEAAFRPVQADTTTLAGINWFWAPSTPTRGDLDTVYFNSAGRGAQLILNYSPDSSGVIPDAQIAAAERVRLTRDGTLKTNLLSGASVTASSSFSAAFPATNVLDNNPETYWAAPDGAGSATLEFALPQPVTGDVVNLREYLRKGQRIGAVTVEGMAPDGSWSTLTTASTVGSRRILQLPSPTTIARLRLTFTGTRGAPLVGEVSFNKRAVAASPSATTNTAAFRGQLQVSLDGLGDAVYYTTDGSKPSVPPASGSSRQYTGPFTITSSTVVKAIVASAPGTVYTYNYQQVPGALTPVAAVTATQSSDWNPNMGAVKAIDGNTTGTVEGGSLASTSGAEPAWWEADLGAVTGVKHIRVWNRTDCCAERLAGAKVYLSDAPFGSTNETVVAQQAGPRVFTLIGTSTTYDLPINVDARYVRIYSKSGYPLSLAEVQFFTTAEEALPWNIASARQSTTTGSATANKAIDNNTDGNYASGSVAATAGGEAKPWWEAALLVSPWVDTLQISNRTDCCGERLDGARVYLSTQPFVSDDELQVANQQGRTVITLNGNQPTYRIPVNRFVKYVRIYGGTGGLNIAEVKAFGTRATSVAHVPTTLAFDARSAQLSSTYPTATAAKAVDGNTNGAWSARSLAISGNNDRSPWWKANLSDTSWIDAITIYNRTDCCGERLFGASVYVSTSPFTATTPAEAAAQAEHTFTVPASPGSSYTISAGVTGRYVMIFTAAGRQLQLAEVQMTGANLD